MTKPKIKKIAILCSGGDAPGMNCAIRSITRTALFHKIQVIGILKGYTGLLTKSFCKLNASSVGNILQRGGTILQTSRSKEFYEKLARKKAYDFLRDEKIDALIVIGGNGSYNGAYALATENNYPVMGIPGTIDNDIVGTQYTIGFDTAIQNAVEAIDKIRDTALSHERTFIVEVMGRKSSALAVHVGLCTGAENIVLPQTNDEVDINSMAQDIKRGVSRGKNSSIIVVSEGEKEGLSYKIQNELLNKYQIESRVCILGHIQRGGAPTALDRFLASRMGYMAVLGLLEGKSNQVAAFVKGEVVLTDLKNCLEKRNNYEEKFVEMIKVLSI